MLLSLVSCVYSEVSLVELLCLMIDLFTLLIVVHISLSYYACLVDQSCIPAICKFVYKRRGI